MNFNVPLSQDIGYNRPVEAAPSVGAAVSSFLTSVVKNIGEAPQPTNDERFAKTLKSYQDKIPELRSTDPSIRNRAITRLTPEFLSNNPEYASEYNSWTNAMGVEIKPTYEENLQTAQEQNRIKYITENPNGQVAYAVATQQFRNEDGSVDERKVNQYVDNSQLKEAQLKATVANLDDEQKIAGTYWNKTVQDGAGIVAQSLSFFNDITDKVSKGETVELPPEIAQSIGVDKVSPSNINTVLLSVRPFIVQNVESSIKETLKDVVGPDILSQPVPKETVDQWMAAFDKTVESVSGNFKDWSTINKNMTAASSNGVLQALQRSNPEFYARIAIANSLPTELMPIVGAQLFGAVNQDVDRLLSEVTLTLQSNATVGDIEQITANSSTADSKDRLTANLNFAQTNRLEGSQIKLNITSIIEDHNKVNSNAQFGWDTYNSVFVKNADGIVEQAAADPVFGAKVTENLNADIRKTLNTANEELSSYGLKVDVVNGDLRLSQRQSDGGWKAIKQGVKETTAAALSIGGLGGLPINPESLDSVKSLRNKWDSLEKFEELGDEIKGAFTQVEDTAFKIDPSSAPANSSVVRLGDVDVAINASMQPLINSMDGASKLTVQGADARMAELLQGPFQRLQKAFGRTLVINDALAKDGTSRETSTKNSRHFHGDAIDIDVSGMSDAERLKLVDEAIAAGFQGFGFGNNILHIDLGSRRAWAYGNEAFGGVSIADLKERVRGSTVGAPTLTATTSGGALDTPEADDNEAAPTMFERLDIKPATNQPASMMADPFATDEAAAEDTGTQPTAPAAVATNAEAVVSKEGQALVDNLGDADKTFASSQELQAAIEAGELEAGDLINVAGEQYIVRKDGTVRKIGG